MKLFEDDWGVDQSPIEDPEITQVIFYLSKADAKLFRALCREGMKVEFTDYIKDGNISDLVMKILKEKYENLLTKKSADTPAGGGVESNVSAG